MLGLLLLTEGLRGITFWILIPCTLVGLLLSLMSPFLPVMLLEHQETQKMELFYWFNDQNRFRDQTNKFCCFLIKLFMKERHVSRVSGYCNQTWFQSFVSGTTGSKVMIELC